MTTDDYLSTTETTRRRELHHGVVRESAAPSWYHQEAVIRLAVLLDAHVRGHGLGRICVSPVDVVLDEANSLVVQPDVVFVSNVRLSRVSVQLWGAPDLAIEVLSPSTAVHDRTIKLDWYRRYDVREVWLVDTSLDRIEAVSFSADDAMTTHFALGEQPVRSIVLPELVLSPADLSA